MAMPLGGQEVLYHMLWRVSWVNSMVSNQTMLVHVKWPVIKGTTDYMLHEIDTICVNLPANMLLTLHTVWTFIKIISISYEEKTVGVDFLTSCVRHSRTKFLLAEMHFFSIKHVLEDWRIQHQVFKISRHKRVNYI